MQKPDIEESKSCPTCPSSYTYLVKSSEGCAVVDPSESRLHQGATLAGKLVR